MLVLNFNAQTIKYQGRCREGAIWRSAPLTGDGFGRGSESVPYVVSQFRHPGLLPTRRGEARLFAWTGPRHSGHFHKAAVTAEVPVPRKTTVKRGVPHVCVIFCKKCTWYVTFA